MMKIPTRFCRFVDNSIRNCYYSQAMVASELGGRRVDITKVDGKIKIVFHPMAKNATKPDAKVFTAILSKKDLETLKKAF